MLCSEADIVSEWRRACVTRRCEYVAWRKTYWLLARGARRTYIAQPCTHGIAAQHCPSSLADWLRASDAHTCTPARTDIRPSRPSPCRRHAVSHTSPIVIWHQESLGTRLEAHRPGLRVDRRWVTGRQARRNCSLVRGRILVTCLDAIQLQADRQQRQRDMTLIFS